MPRPGVTFLIPCLNEAVTLPKVLGAIQAFRRGPLRGRPSEILVSDNGSDDGSQALARKAGARVVHCPVRGYGAALRHGIAQARFPYVVFADADATYDFSESGPLIQGLDAGADLVLGSRLAGRILPGAMPWSHRWIGTPLLTAAINGLHGHGGKPLTDCNSGFRALRKDAHASWGLTSDGMEYASEMLVEALRHGADVREVPASLAPDTRGRPPHLRRWRDGMRHLLQILVVAPGAFTASGRALWILSWLLLAGGALATHEVAVGPFYVLGLHTLLFALLGSLLGLAVWSVGLFLAVRDPARARGLTRWLLELPEEKLFWLGALGGGFSALVLAAIIVAWSVSGFANLHLERQTVVAVAFAANGMLLLWNTLSAHLIKRLWNLERAVWKQGDKPKRPRRA